jgi:hypothetical protein
VLPNSDIVGALSHLEIGHPTKNQGSRIHFHIQVCRVYNARANVFARFVFSDEF